MSITKMLLLISALFSFSMICSNADSDEIEVKPVVIANFIANSAEMTEPFPKRFCSYFNKHSNSSMILLSGKNCHNSLVKVIQALKTCRQSTDSLYLAVLKDEVEEDANFMISACQCLLSENATFFLNRGISNDLHGGIQINVQVACEIFSGQGISHNVNYLSYQSNSTDPIVIANQFSLKSWAELKIIDDLLLPSRNISASAAAATKTDLQEFPTSAICLHLKKNCQKVERKDNLSLLKALTQSNSSIHVVVYVLPNPDPPWEVELSPVNYVDQLIFVMLRQWQQGDNNVKFVKSFGMDLWASLVATLLIVAITLLLLSCGKNNIIPATNFSEYSKTRRTICFTLLVSLLEQPQKVFARHVEVYLMLGFWWLVVTSLTTSYKSKLVENLIKREQVHLPSTIGELLNRSEFRISHNLIAGMARSIQTIGGDTIKKALNRSELIPSSQDQMKCLVYTLVDNFACLTMTSSNKLNASILATSVGMKYISINKIWHFSEESTSIYATWAYRRGFVFKDKMNDALGRINQAGLPMKWYDSILAMTKWVRNRSLNITAMFPKSNSTTRTSYGEKLRKYVERSRQSWDSEYLAMTHILPVFQLCSFLLCAAFFILTLEVAVYRCTRFVTRPVATVNKYRDNIRVQIIVSHYYHASIN